MIQEAFTCTCLKVHPHEAHFVAQSNGDYIALFSTRKPYKLNKFKRYEGHKVLYSISVTYKKIMNPIENGLHFILYSHFHGHPYPSPYCGRQTPDGRDTEELSALQWGQMKRANPLPPGLSQINTTAVFIVQ